MDFAVRRVLSRLRAGRLQVTLPGGRHIDHRAPEPGVEAALIIHRWRAIRRLVRGGDVGFAKAYIDGDWSTPDLTALIELIARSGEDFTDGIAGGLVFQAANWIKHSLRANTRAGSRRNIEYHYDLGNDFYRLWLDRSMLYSSAIYADAAQSLEEAQGGKIGAILEALALSQGDRVLEIGCGWGALAIAMASQNGARVTGITLSPSQLDYARAAVADAGVAGSIDLRLEDYRDTRGRFDRIVSIEMIEAVGQKYWPNYFGCLRERLNPEGVAVVQAITIAESRFESYSGRPDFIQRYIFPGGLLPSKTKLKQAVQDAGLTIRASHHFGGSYALTLAEWRRRFIGAWPKIEAMGFDASFRRLWEFYLCYCEAGFRAGVIDVGLYSLAHARAA